MAEANQSKLEDKAQTLGRAIGQTDVAKAMDRAQKAIQENEETLELIKKVQQLEQQLMQKVQQGQEVDEDDQEELRSAMTELETKPEYQQLVAAQQNMENMMKQVNENIQEGIEEGKKSKIIEI